RVVKRRIALVEIHGALRRREMRDDGDFGVAAHLADKIARRVLPPVDLTAAERRRRRKRIQCHPLDPVEMRHLWPGGEPNRTVRPRWVLGKSLEDGARR